MEPSIPGDVVLERANKITALLLAADKDFGELVFRERRLSSGGVVLIRLMGLSAERKAEIVSKLFEERGSEFTHAFTVNFPRQGKDSSTGLSCWAVPRLTTACT